jgi:hypothetical protein
LLSLFLRIQILNCLNMGLMSLLYIYVIHIIIYKCVFQLIVVINCYINFNNKNLHLWQN